MATVITLDSGSSSSEDEDDAGTAKLQRATGSRPDSGSSSVLDLSAAFEAAEPSAAAVKAEAGAGAGGIGSFTAPRASEEAAMETGEDVPATITPTSTSTSTSAAPSAPPRDVAFVPRVGQLVWALDSDDQWWPGIVTHSPDGTGFLTSDSSSCHLELYRFDSKHGWFPLVKLRKWDNDKRLWPEGLAFTQKSEEWNQSLDLANDSAFLRVPERLKLISYPVTRSRAEATAATARPASAPNPTPTSAPAPKKTHKKTNNAIRELVALNDVSLPAPTDGPSGLRRTPFHYSQTDFLSKLDSAARSSQPRSKPKARPPPRSEPAPEPAPEPAAFSSGARSKAARTIEGVVVEARRFRAEIRDSGVPKRYLCCVCNRRVADMDTARHCALCARLCHKLCSDQKAEDWYCPKCWREFSCGACRELVTSPDDAEGCTPCGRYFHAGCAQDALMANGRCGPCQQGEPEKLIAWRGLDRKDALLSGTREFYVKFKGLSHLHCQWVGENWVNAVAKLRLRYFDRRRNKEYTGGKLLAGTTTEVQRIIKSGPKDKYFLVKWTGLEYDHSTTESRADLEPLPSFEQKFEEFSARRSYAQHKRRRTPARERHPDYFEELSLPFSFPLHGTLQPHQMEGVNWLVYKWYERKNSILADEMGLGKTIQTIAFVSYLSSVHGRGPFLIVVPLSTCQNWDREFSIWAPELNVVIYSGQQPARSFIQRNELRGSFDVVVTSWELVKLDKSVFFRQDWDAMIVDEGHRLKNTKSKLFQILDGFRAKHRLLLTGTPLQNRIQELFALLEFLQLDIYSQYSEFETLEGKQILEFKQVLQAYILRRVKSKVYKDLPPKIELVVPVRMSALQQSLYKLILEKNFEMLTSGSKKSLRNIWMQLRKLCNHPYQLDDVEPHIADRKAMIERFVLASGKFVLLDKMLPKLQASNHRTLLFSQFTRTLDIIQDLLDYRSIKFFRLDGSTQMIERQRLIKEFNQPDCDTDVFLLSTRAGGLGINLTGADTVLIFDSDWNPHMDLQAIARSHRFGQTRRVLVLRLAIQDSIEEKLIQRANEKLMLDQAFASTDKMSSEDVDDLLKHGAKAVFQKEYSDEELQFDDAAIEALLDRSQAATVDPEHASDQEGGLFANMNVARVWAPSKAKVTHTTEAGGDETAEQDRNFWKQLLESRIQATKEQELRESGRGFRRRSRDRPNYSELGPGDSPKDALYIPEFSPEDDEADGTPPGKESRKRRKTPSPWKGIPDKYHDPKFASMRIDEVAYLRFLDENEADIMRQNPLLSTEEKIVQFKRTWEGLRYDEVSNYRTQARLIISEAAKPPEQQTWQAPESAAASPKRRHVAVVCPEKLFGYTGARRFRYTGEPDIWLCTCGMRNDDRETSCKLCSLTRAHPSTPTPTVYLCVTYLFAMNQAVDIGDGATFLHAVERHILNPASTVKVAFERSTICRPSAGTQLLSLCQKGCSNFTDGYSSQTVRIEEAWSGGRRVQIVWATATASMFRKQISLTLGGPNGQQQLVFTSYEAIPTTPDFFPTGLNWQYADHPTVAHCPYRKDEDHLCSHECGTVWALSHRALFPEGDWIKNIESLKSHQVTKAQHYRLLLEELSLMMRAQQLEAGRLRKEIQYMEAIPPADLRLRLAQAVAEMDET